MVKQIERTDLKKEVKNAIEQKEAHVCVVVNSVEDANKFVEEVINKDEFKEARERVFVGNNKRVMVLTKYEIEKGATRSYTFTSAFIDIGDMSISVLHELGARVKGEGELICIAV